MLSSLFAAHQKQDQGTTLILDVGTEAVKAVIYGVEKGQKKVLGGSIEYFDPFGSWGQQGGLDFKSQVVKKFVLKASKEAVNISGRIPDNVKINFSDIQPTTAQVHYERKERQKRILKTEEREIFQKVNEDAKGVAIKNMAERGINREDVFFISLKTLSLTIDGYKVPSALNFNGKDLIFRILVLTASKKHLGRLSLPVWFPDFKKESGWNFKSVSSLHLAQAVADLAAYLKDCILLDVGGSLTQVFIVRQGTLDWVSAFNKGGEDFSKRLAEKMGVNPASAITLKEQYSRTQAGQAFKDKIAGEFKILTDDWFRALNNNLPAGNGGILPAQIFLMGGGSLLSDIKDVLSGDAWIEYSLGGGFDIKFLYPSDVPHIKIENKIQVTPQYTPAIFLCHGYAPK